MSNNPAPANRPADPEPRRPLREWLIDALALGMGGLAVLYYKPDGFIAGLIVFVGAYTITNLLHAVNLKSLAGICAILLAWLAIVIHLTTLMTAPMSFTGLVFTFLLPGIAQAYWLWELWPAAGTLSHPLAMICAVWLALFATWIAAKTMIGGRPAVQAN
jgi:hypothetical protein